MEKQQRTSDELLIVNKVLDRFYRGDVSAVIFLDVRNPKENGDCSVKIRVTRKQEQHYYRCMDISLDEWETLVNGKKPRGVLLKTKNFIYAYFKMFTDVIEDLAPGKHFSFVELNRRLSRGTRDSVLDAFRNKIAKLQDDGRIGTRDWYTCALNSITKYSKKDVKFSDVTPEWLY